MNVIVGPWRRLSAEEPMFLNCGSGEDSWKSVGQQRDQACQTWIFIGRADAKDKAPILWPPDVKTWHWKRPWCWKGLTTGGEGDDRGWDDWMVSLTRVWANAGRWWRAGKPGMLQSMVSQRVGHDLVTEHHQQLNNCDDDLVVTCV